MAKLIPRIPAADEDAFRKQRNELLLLLKRTDWDLGRVARILGVSRQTVYRRLKNYGIRGAT
jgi:transcriptional regulator of acetoin/glycerol metabolism